MIIKTVTLSDNVTLDCYISNAAKVPRKAMLVLPGGGYSKICHDHEGEPIALAFVAKGFNAFVLSYHVAPLSDPYQPLIDASMAMAYIRTHAKELIIDPCKVYAVGFSAGAHLAAMLSNLWNDSVLMQKTGLTQGVNRPTAVALCYPVINSEMQNDERVFTALLGDKAGDKALRKRFSADETINADSVPAFVVCTMTDEVVPVKNSLRFAGAMAAQGILCELHVYPKGPHGMALANANTNIGLEQFTDEAYARWVDDACVFFNRIV